MYIYIYIHYIRVFLPVNRKLKSDTILEEKMCGRRY